MIELTILTPTFNRENTLRQCYDSLKKQTCKKFEWLVVDDGSTDNTRELINSFIKEEKITIRYVYKDNGGKHTALNLGLALINSKMTIILDSDDYLTDDAVAQIMLYDKRYGKRKDLCGFSFLKLFPDGKVIGKKYPIDEEIATYIERRVNGRIYGDKCEVFYNTCLQKYRFPVFEGEKFIGESTVWILMGLEYSMVHINKGIYIGEYLEDGLTKLGRKIRIACPRGGMINSQRFMIPQCNIYNRIKAGILYNCYSFFAKNKVIDTIKENPYRFISVITMPFGYSLYRYWKSKYY